MEKVLTRPLLKTPTSTSTSTSSTQLKPLTGRLIQQQPSPKEVTKSLTQRHVREEYSEVQDLVTQVKTVFDQREAQKTLLKNKLESKSHQLDYLEKQTREHAAALARLGAYLNVNKARQDTMESEAKDFEDNHFNQAVAAVGKLCEKGDQGNELIKAMDDDLNAIRQVKDALLVRVDAIRKANADRNIRLLEESVQQQRLLDDIAAVKASIKEKEEIKAKLASQVHEKRIMRSTLQLEYDALTLEAQILEKDTEEDRLVLDHERSRCVEEKTVRVQILSQKEYECQEKELQISNVKAELTAMEQDANDKNRSIDHLKRVVHDATCRQGQLRERVQQFMSEKTKLRSEIDAVTEITSTVLSERTTCDDELRKLRSSLESLSVSNAELETDVDKCYLQINQRRQEIHQVSKERPEVQWENDRLLKALEDQIMEWTAKQQQLNHDSDEAAIEVKQLDDEAIGLSTIKSETEESFAQVQAQKAGILSHLLSVEDENRLLHHQQDQARIQLANAQALREESIKLQRVKEEEVSSLESQNQILNDIDDEVVSINESITRTSIAIDEPVVLSEEDLTAIQHDVDLESGDYSNELEQVYLKEKRSVDKNLQAIDTRTKQLETQHQLKRADIDRHRQKIDLAKLQLQQLREAKASKQDDVDHISQEDEPSDQAMEVEANMSADSNEDNDNDDILRDYRQAIGYVVKDDSPEPSKKKVRWGDKGQEPTSPKQPPRSTSKAASPFSAKSQPAPFQPVIRIDDWFMEDESFLG